MTDCEIKCDVGEFQCVNGKSMCMDETARCNGTCDDMEYCCDENDCGVTVCDGFLCDNNSTCIPTDQRCNQRVQCTDMSDELGCSKFQVFSFEQPKIFPY